MRYINEYGYQFGYSLIHGNGPLPFNFFYTSNISIPKALLDDLEYAFDEDFDTYGVGGRGAGIPVGKKTACGFFTTLMPWRTTTIP